MEYLPVPIGLTSTYCEASPKSMGPPDDDAEGVVDDDDEAS